MKTNEVFGSDKPKIKLTGRITPVENNRCKYSAELLDSKSGETLAHGKLATWEDDRMELDKDGVVQNFVLDRNSKYLLNPESFGKSMDDSDLGVG